jgi:glycerophosphoryl diester phosphodiesterase
MGCGGQPRGATWASVGKVEIVAHRGASFAAPENTLAAASLAWARGSDAVEVDVHLSLDGRIVAIHDRSTARTGGRHLRIARTESTQLRRLDVGRYKGPEFKGERIPFLEEILAILPPGRRLFVEVKCGPEIIPALNHVLAASGKKRQIVVIGFGLETMEACKKALPDIPVYWLCKSNPFIPHGRELIFQAAACGLDGLDVHHAGLTPGFVRSARAAGLDLYVWTVDNARQAAVLSTWGVDGITTNRPARLCQRVGPVVASAQTTTDDTERRRVPVFAQPTSASTRTHPAPRRSEYENIALHTNRTVAYIGSSSR